MCIRDSTYTARPTTMSNAKVPASQDIGDSGGMGVGGVLNKIKNHNNENSNKQEGDDKSHTSRSQNLLSPYRDDNSQDVENPHTPERPHGLASPLNPHGSNIPPNEDDVDYTPQWGRPHKAEKPPVVENLLRLDEPPKLKKRNGSTITHHRHNPQWEIQDEYSQSD